MKRYTAKHVPHLWSSQNFRVAGQHLTEFHCPTCKLQKQSSIEHHHTLLFLPFAVCFTEVQSSVSSTNQRTITPMGDGILVSLHLINMASPLPLPPQLRGFQIVNNNRFQDKSASRLCRGGGGGGLAVFGNGQNGFLPLRLRRLLSRGEAAAAMEQRKQQQLEGGGFSDRKEARRAAKERKKQEEATRREQEWQAKLATHSEQQMDAIRRRIVEVSHMRREARKARKLKLEQAMKMGAPDIVIDLEFSHLMTTSQLSSLMQQVRKERNPIPLNPRIPPISSSSSHKPSKLQIALLHPQSRSRACYACMLLYSQSGSRACWCCMMLLYPQSKARACDAACSCITSDTNLQPSHRQVGLLSYQRRNLLQRNTTTKCRFRPANAKVEIICSWFYRILASIYSGQSVPHAHGIEVVWCTVYLHWLIEESMTQKKGEVLLWCQREGSYTMLAFCNRLHRDCCRWTQQDSRIPPVV